MVSVIAPLYHPVYELVEKIFQLIPKLFEAFNMNEYFIGFEIGEPHHLPIDFMELHLCRSTIPAKQRRGNFQNFLLRVMRCSILVTFQSVVPLHTCACAFPVIIISCLKSHVCRWTVFKIHLCLRPRVGDEASMKIVIASLPAWMLDSSIQI